MEDIKVKWSKEVQDKLGKWKERKKQLSIQEYKCAGCSRPISYSKRRTGRVTSVENDKWLYCRMCAIKLRYG